MWFGVSKAGCSCASSSSSVSLGADFTCGGGDHVHEFHVRYFGHRSGKHPEPTGNLHQRGSKGDVLEASSSDPLFLDCLYSLDLLEAALD